MSLLHRRLIVVHNTKMTDYTQFVFARASICCPAVSGPMVAKRWIRSAPGPGLSPHRLFTTLPHPPWANSSRWYPNTGIGRRLIRQLVHSDKEIVVQHDTERLPLHRPALQNLSLARGSSRRILTFVKEVRAILNHGFIWLARDGVVAAIIHLDTGRACDREPDGFRRVSIPSKHGATATAPSILRHHRHAPADHVAQPWVVRCETGRSLRRRQSHPPRRESVRSAHGRRRSDPADYLYVPPYAHARAMLRIISTARLLCGIACARVPANTRACTFAH